MYIVLTCKYTVDDINTNFGEQSSHLPSQNKYGLVRKEEEEEDVFNY